MTAYYNENDPFAAVWLRELIKEGHIAPGDVDERDIEDVVPNDLANYDQCHFFAGIGGWSYALRLAGWPDNKPVWTGSAPCQPFSEAGARGGIADDRHLWPAFYWLIQQRRPSVVFGEQVASPLGLRWWDIVATDLESLAYACVAFDLPAACVGAPHRRQRLYWVANADGDQRGEGGQDIMGKANARRGCPLCVGNPIGAGLEGRRITSAGGRASIERTGECLGNAQCGPFNRESRGRPEVGFENANVWSSSQWIMCRDGKWRIIPTEPALFPLAHGIPGRVGILRGAGNAIVPQVASAFISACMELW